MDSVHFWNFEKRRHAYVVLDVPRDDLDHLELVPYKARHKFFFNGVEVPGQLPELSAEQRLELKRLAQWPNPRAKLTTPGRCDCVR